MLPHFVKSINYSLAWRKALAHTYEKSYSEALSVLQSIPIEQGKFGFDVKVLMAFLLTALKKYEKSHSLCEELITEVEKIEKLGQHERDYMRAYIYWIAGQNVDKIGRSRKMERPQWLSLDAGSFGVDGVPGHWKAAFPIRVE